MIIQLAAGARALEQDNGPADGSVGDCGGRKAGETACPTIAFMRICRMW